MAPKRKTQFLPRLPVQWASPNDARPTASPTASGGDCDPRGPRVGARSRSPCQGSAAASGLADRKDAPLILPARRLNKAAASAAAVSETSRRDAMAIYEERVHAPSTVGSRTSAWITWQKYHKLWFGTGPEAPPVLPLTPWSIAAVSAMMLAGNYRSIPNYISRAKDEHMRAWEWTSALAREQRRANAAGRRGMGPAHQSAELPLVLAAGLNVGQEPLVEHGPADFRAYIDIAGMFLLREVEASLALARSVTVNRDAKVVSINLPATKTDPRALACHRSWGCTCGGDRRKVCAFHAAASHQDYLRATFGDDRGLLPEDLPFFPDTEGNAVCKSKVVESVEVVALRLGLPLCTSDGRNNYGGHVFRVSGARHLAAIGMDIRVIMIHARWQSNVVLRYVQEAPLIGLTEEYIKLSAAATAGRRMPGPAGAADRDSADDPGAFCFDPADLDHPANRPSPRLGVAPMSLSCAGKLTPCLDAGAAGTSSTSSDAPVAAEHTESQAQVQQALVFAREAMSVARELQTTLEACKQEMAELKLKLLPPFVSSQFGTGVVHECANSFIERSPSEWLTKCGWRYSDSQFRRMTQIPADGDARRLCARCFRA